MDQHVVVTRFQKKAHGRVITHAYHAHSKSEAQTLRKWFLTNQPAPKGGSLEVTVCKVLGVDLPL